MEQYAYYSILIFSGFIFFLYIYLFYEKILSIYQTKQIHKNEKFLIPYLDKLFLKMEDDYPSFTTILKIRKKIKNKIIRNIVIKRVIYFNSFFTGNIQINLTKFCEDVYLIKYIIKDLRTNDNNKISLSSKYLGEFRSNLAIPDLLKVLNKKTPNIQYNALMALAKIGDNTAFIEGFTKINNNIVINERSLIEIIDTFEGDKISLYNTILRSENSFVLSIFIKSYGNNMDVLLNDYLSGFIKNGTVSTKIAAIKVVGQTADINYLEDLIECLQNEFWEVRAVSAKSLGMLEDGRALPALIKSLSDKEWWVRYNSAVAILKIPTAINEITEVFIGDDSFAKDIMLNAMETNGVFSELYLFEHSIDYNKRYLAELVNNYIKNLENEDKKNELESN